MEGHFNTFIKLITKLAELKAPFILARVKMFNSPTYHSYKPLTKNYLTNKLI